MLEQFKEHANKVTHIFKLLQSRGCMVQSSETQVHVRIPRNALGIKAWGYVDFLVAISGGKFTYMLDDRLKARTPAPRTKTRKVASIKADKLEQREKMHAKKPWKYAAVAA